MGTEIFTFGPLEPEKMGFKDSNPAFEIMTKTALLWSKFFSAILSDGFFQYNSLHHLIIWALKACQTNNNLERSTMIYIWKRSKWHQINWMRICRSSNPIARNAGQTFFFASSITTNLNIEILIDGVKFSLTSTKVKKIQGDPSLNMAKQIRIRGELFLS